MLVSSLWFLVYGFYKLTEDFCEQQETSNQELVDWFYAGVTRRLISTASEECVSAPTEMKSTPVSA